MRRSKARSEALAEPRGNHSKRAQPQQGDGMQRSRSTSRHFTSHVPRQLPSPLPGFDIGDAGYPGACCAAPRALFHRASGTHYFRASPRGIPESRAEPHPALPSSILYPPSSLRSSSHPSVTPAGVWKPWKWRQPRACFAALRALFRRASGTRLLLLAFPVFGEACGRHRRNRQPCRGVMRRIVEERQARADGVLEIDNI